MSSALRCYWLLCVLWGLGGCSLSARFVQTAVEPPASQPDAAEPALITDAGADAAAPAAPSCPASLAARISTTQIDLDVDIRYKDASYDFFPVDMRVAFAVAPNGSAYVAWVDNASGNLRVTPLDAKLTRRAPDVLVQGGDIGGLVARDDGFALLTRREDPGEPPQDPNDNNSIAKAVFFVRYRGTREVFAVPLTGTASITHAADPNARDCAPDFLYGRLAWNGARYGAYFLVHGCAGDPHASNYGDKIVYADDRGGYVKGGWGWNCSKNAGLRLVPEVDAAFTSICLSDALPNPGLNLVVEGKPARQLALEMYANGYVAGQFGSLAKLADDSYVIGWLSRGVTSSSRPTSAKPAADIAMIRLGPDYAQIGVKKWFFETPNIAETNLHLVPYGPNRLLFVWEKIEKLNCTNLTCFGTYAGTFVRLSDLDGNPVGAETRIEAVPNTADDIAVFANGDLGWAYVPDDARNYTTELARDRAGVATVPAKRRLSVARMRYCE